MKIHLESLKWVLAFGIEVCLLSACSQSPEWVKAQREKINVRLFAPITNYRLTGTASANMNLLINDFDGVVVSRTWEQGLGNKKTEGKLRDCLDKSVSNYEPIWNRKLQQSELIREQASLCVVELRLPTFTETIANKPQRLVLQIVVATNRINQGEGVPIFSSGNTNLGSVLHISRPDIDYGQTYADVDQCLNQSAAEGVIQALSSGPPSYSDFGLAFSSQSIAPMLNRLTNCLINLGYTIEKG